jgi:uncharacterized membrane protein YgcG
MPEILFLFVIGVIVLSIVSNVTKARGSNSFRNGSRNRDMQDSTVNYHMMMHHHGQNDVNFNGIPDNMEQSRDLDHDGIPDDLEQRTSMESRSFDNNSVNDSGSFDSGSSFDSGRSSDSGGSFDGGSSSNGD